MYVLYVCGIAKIIICVIPYSRGIREDRYSGHKSFRFLYNSICLCFFLREDSVSQPVSLYRLSIYTCFGAPVTMRAASFCSFSVSFISYCENCPILHLHIKV